MADKETQSTEGHVTEYPGMRIPDGSHPLGPQDGPGVRRRPRGLLDIETELHGVLDATSDAIVIVDHEGRVVLANSQIERLFGYAREELIGKLVEVLVPQRFHKVYAARRVDFFDDPGARPMGTGLELYGLRKDNREFPAEISLSLLRTEEDILISSAIRDITERKNADEKFLTLLESTLDAMVIIGSDGRIVLMNTQTETLFGYGRNELLGQPVEILVPDRLRGTHPQHRAHYFSSPKRRSMGSGLELYGRRRDGTEFPVEISLSPLATEAGTLVSSTIRDITEQKRADELKSRLAAIVDSSIDAIIGETLSGIMTSWNKGAERIFGYTAEEAIGQPISMLLPAGYRDEEPESLQRLSKHERIEPFETLRCRKGGQVIHASVTISPVRDARGNLVGASNLARDISDRKRADEALALAKDAAESASREFEAFGYSVAHDLRAPLRGIEGFSRALSEDCSDTLDSHGQHYITQIRDAVQRMGRLIDSLLALARLSQSDVRRQPVDLTAMAHEVFDRLQSEEPDRNVEFLVSENLTCEGDSRLLEIALANLLGNAWKFTGKRSNPRIEFGVTQYGEPNTFFVTDNGAGFDMAFADRLFGVFQRLHAGGEFEGIGIGLATVQRIVRRHGGRIWANAVEGHGATFYFTLDNRGS